MKVWVSERALTRRGIYEADVHGRAESPYVWPIGGGRGFKVGRDAHETREAAVADAERRRVAKIASLKRQIARLEALTWEEQP